MKKTKHPAFDYLAFPATKVLEVVQIKQAIGLGDHSVNLPDDPMSQDIMAAISVGFRWIQTVHGSAIFERIK